jgi:hypothetical protein
VIAVWTTADGRSIPVGAMERSHILRTMAAIRSGRIKRRMCDGLNRAEWLLVFAAELVRRDRLADTPNH